MFIVCLLNDSAEEDDDAAADGEYEPDDTENASDDVFVPSEFVGLLNGNHAGREPHHSH